MAKKSEQSKHQNSYQPLPVWMVFLLLLLYLRALQPPPQPALVSLNRVIWAVTLILIILIATTAGDGSQAAAVLNSFSMLP